MNAQSNNIEHTFVKEGIPYHIYGGTRFYDRKEIKDLLAYMTILYNPYDMIRFKRIVNEPKRGIGDRNNGNAGEYHKRFRIVSYSSNAGI